LSKLKRVMADRDGSRERGVIDAIIEAGGQPELWPSAFQKLAGLINAEGWLLGGPNSFFAPICSPSLDRVLEYDLREGWVDKNAQVERCSSVFAQGHDIVTESMIFSSSELDHLQYKDEFVNHIKCRRFAAVIVAGEGPSSVILELQRPAASQPFSGPEIETLRRLKPHLQETGKLASRAARIHINGLLDAFSAFDCGVILLDWRGRVLLVNPKAEVLMSPTLGVWAGFLRASVGEGDTALKKLISSVIDQGTAPAAEPPCVITIARPGASPLLVQAAPLPSLAADRLKHARVALIIGDRDAHRRLQVPDLRQMFGLTSSEADVAVELASGHDIGEISKMRRVSPGTLHAQLRSIFKKTETRRQAELVGLLLRCSALPM
jgi:DNA-binding CsgD family transcriptional regulator